MTPKRRPGQIVLAAMARGAIAQSQAADYLARAANGESIEFLDDLAAIPAAIRGDVFAAIDRQREVRAHSWPTALSAIEKALGDAGHIEYDNSGRVEDQHQKKASAGDASDLEWAQMFGAGNPRAAAALAAAREAGRQRVADLTDDQLFNELFPRDQ